MQIIFESLFSSNVISFWKMFLYCSQFWGVFVCSWDSLCSLLSSLSYFDLLTLLNCLKSCGGYIAMYWLEPDVGSTVFGLVVAFSCIGILSHV